MVNNITTTKPELIPKLETVFSVMAFSGKDVQVPAHFKDIAKNLHSKQWFQACKEEFDSHIKNETWEYVKLPKGRKLVDSRWTFQLKLNPDGSVKRFKARFVCKGFTQVYGLDYIDTFAPVVGMVSLRMMLAFATGNEVLRNMVLREKCWY